MAESATASAADGLSLKDRQVATMAVQLMQDNPDMYKSVRFCYNYRLNALEAQLFVDKPVAEKAKMQCDAMPVDGSNTPATTTAPFKFDVPKDSLSVPAAASSPLHNSPWQVKKPKVNKVDRNAISARSGLQAPLVPAVPSTRAGAIAAATKRCASRSPSPDVALGESPPSDAASGEVKFKLGDRPEPDVPLDDPRWKAYIDKCETRQLAYEADRPRGGGDEDEESGSGSGGRGMVPCSEQDEDADWPTLMGFGKQKQRVKHTTSRPR